MNTPHNFNIDLIYHFKIFIKNTLITPVANHFIVNFPQGNFGKRQCLRV